MSREGSAYQLRIRRSAEAYVAGLDRRTQERIGQRLDQIVQDPYGPHTKPLTGPGRRRSSRLSGYRIVFTVDDTARLVEVSRIGARGQVYRGL